MNVLVRWLRSDDVMVRGEFVRTGDTFEMPLEEAKLRADVELVFPFEDDSIEQPSDDNSGEE